jgi:putative acetyltransferase
MKGSILLRLISPEDNAVIAHIIRATLTEFGAARLGTVYYDESTDHLSDIFTIPASVYYIAESGGTIVGGAGIYPTAGLGPDTCELVKMYLLPQARGLGIGRMLIEKCIDFARSQRYKQLYLETMPELSMAIGLYEKMAFTRLSAPLGSSGHFGCGIWMAKDLI